MAISIAIKRNITLPAGFALDIVLGFVFQHSHFCITDAFRDVWLSKSTGWLTAFLVTITVQAVFVQLMTSFGWIVSKPDQFVVWAVINSLFVFGPGIVPVGGCTAGAYYRSGEGLTGSWIAPSLHASTSAVVKHGVGRGVTDALRGAM